MFEVGVFTTVCSQENTFIFLQISKTVILCFILYIFRGEGSWGVKSHLWLASRSLPTVRAAPRATSVGRTRSESRACTVSTTCRERACTVTSTLSQSLPSLFDDSPRLNTGGGGW